MQTVDNQEFANFIAMGKVDTHPIDGDDSIPQDQGLLAKLVESLPNPEAQASTLSDNFEGIGLTNNNNDGPAPV